MSEDYSSGRHSGASSKSRKYHHHHSGQEAGVASGLPDSSSIDSASAATSKASSKSSSKRRHRRRRRNVGSDYARQKAQIEKINAQNLLLDADAMKRMILVSALVVIVVCSAAFLFHWGRYGGGRLSLMGRYAVVTASLLALLWGIRSLSVRILELKSLIQFQETRVDSLKVTLVHLEKKIADLSHGGKTDGKNGGNSSEERFG